MTPTYRRVTAALGVAALIAVAVVLMVRGLSGEPTARSPAASAGVEDPPPASCHGSALTCANPGDWAWWDPDDGEDPDAAAWNDPAVRPLRVRVLGLDHRPAGGVPVVVLGRGEPPTVLAGPKASNADGRVRFPIGVAMEQEREIVVAARAIPGHAAWSALDVALDQPADVTLALECGLRGLVQVFDPEGRPVLAARVRKLILGEPAAETGPHAHRIGHALAEATPVGVRVPGGYELVGLRSPEELTLVTSARGFATVSQAVAVPRDAPSPFPIDVKLGARTSFVRFELVPPVETPGAHLSYSCRRTGARKLVLSLGVDEIPSQRSPVFAFEVPADDPHRLEAHAGTADGVCALAEVDIPALREGEVFDAGRIRLAPLPVVLAGQVLDHDQRPLRGAVVEAIGKGGGDMAATTTADGRFVLRAPAGRGPYQVSAHAPGRVSETQADVAEPAHELRFVLEPGGAIVGSIVLPAGIDPEGVSIRASAGTRRPATTGLLADGTFELAGLPSGAYTVTIEGAGINPIRVADVVVSPAEATRDGRLERIQPLRSEPRQP